MFLQPCFSNSLLRFGALFGVGSSQGPRLLFFSAAASRLDRKITITNSLVSEPTAARIAGRGAPALRLETIAFDAVGNFDTPPWACFVIQVRILHKFQKYFCSCFVVHGVFEQGAWDGALLGYNFAAVSKCGAGQRKFRPSRCRGCDRVAWNSSGHSPG
jgi:hypothetical protein